MSKRDSIVLTMLFLVFIGFFFVANLIVPDRTFSQVENRYLQQLPKLTQSSFSLGLNKTSGDFFSGEFMSDFETYVTDQFVGRDIWTAGKAALEVGFGKQENNGVYLCDQDTLIPRFDAPDGTRVQKNVEYVNKLVEHMDIPVTFGLIPGKVSVWSDRLPAHAPNASESALIDAARSGTTANWTDLAGAMNAHRLEEIYYRLDHHWTSLGAYYGYVAVMESMGITPIPLSQYERQTVSTDFNGTTFSTAGVRWMEPDRIDFYVPEDGITVTSWKGPQAETGMLYDPSKLLEKDQYTFFLGGNQSLAMIDTANDQAPKLLVIRDSYSDTMAPFLTPHFSEIHLFDPRYNKTPLSKYIAENEIDQVLVLYSVANFVSDSNLFVLGT